MAPGGGVSLFLLELDGLEAVCRNDDAPSCWVDDSEVVLPLSIGLPPAVCVELLLLAFSRKTSVGGARPLELDGYRELCSEC